MASAIGRHAIRHISMADFWLTAMSRYPILTTMSFTITTAAVNTKFSIKLHNTKKIGSVYNQKYHQQNCVIENVNNNNDVFVFLMKKMTNDYTTIHHEKADK